MIARLLIATALALLIGRASSIAQVAATGDADAVNKHESSGDGGSDQIETSDEAGEAAPGSGLYRSPYSLTFKVPLGELLFDARSGRGSVAEESSVPLPQWYSPKVRQRWGSWGVPARLFDCPPQVHGKPVEWRRERVVAAATRLIGYEYQHHHVPDWDPPGGWPWQKTCAGRNGKGVDCSNFSGWNYNWALGIHLNTDVHKQAEQTRAPSTHGEIVAEVIRRPVGNPNDWYDGLVATLRPGDLLYIGDKARTKVTHVIMWAGHCAESPDGIPLVIDSTGGRIKDSRGYPIPCGIHIRPFRKGSWYHLSFSHAHRWVR